MKRGKCNDTLLRNVGQVYMSHLRPVECESGGRPLFAWLHESLISERMLQSELNFAKEHRLAL